jgi:hypothetical protein
MIKTIRKVCGRPYTTCSMSKHWTRENRKRGGGPPLSPFLFPGPIFFEMLLSDLSQTLQIAFCVEGSLEAEAGDQEMGPWDN